MSAKLRVTLWFTLMVLLLAAMVLVFVLVINGASITDDPAGRLVKVVLRNADKMEFEHGRFEWDDLDSYKRGVYCVFYGEDGELLYGAQRDEWEISLPLEANVIREVTAGGEKLYVYDTMVDMDVAIVWIRGVIPAADRSGVMHTIIILTCTLLPALIVLSVAGGWLIARGAFRPMEKIVSAANSISDGDDMSLRINMTRGPSEMRRLAASFDKMLGRLEQSFNTERQFASDASHELRTPITVILAECDRAKRKDVTREDFLGSIAVIEEQGRGMSELVQSLLSLTRMQQGTDRYPLRRADLSEFVEACCDEFVPADRRGITLHRDITAGVCTEFNHALMSRVVQNLLQNAYKYGREGGRIDVALREQDGSAVLTVADDGIGIEQKNLDRIWQRFWQADASRGEDGGSGLGLAMVKEITQFHGGTVGVESEPGPGCKPFKLTVIDLSGGRMGKFDHEPVFCRAHIARKPFHADGVKPFRKRFLRHASAGQNKGHRLIVACAAFHTTPGDRTAGHAVDTAQYAFNHAGENLCRLVFRRSYIYPADTALKKEKSVRVHIAKVAGMHPAHVVFVFFNDRRCFIGLVVIPQHCGWRRDADFPYPAVATLSPGIGIDYLYYICGERYADAAGSVCTV